jgi:hypothetical protein
MPTPLDSKTEARIADLAKRLGLFGPDAQQRVLQMALDDLEAKTFPQPREMALDEIAAELQELKNLSAVGRRWREEHPDEYDEDNPPSIAWQQELYDTDGLPI